MASIWCWRGGQVAGLVAAERKMDQRLESEKR